MATSYSTNKYARVKGLKNEPLSQLTLGLKKCKLGEGKDETPAPLSLFGTPSSPTPSLDMMTFTPPTTRSKGKNKTGISVWENRAMALRRAHNIITNDELKGLSSIPLMNWLTITFTNLCRYFTQLLLLFIKFLHLLKALILFPSSGSWRIPMFDDRLLGQ